MLSRETGHSRVPAPPHISTGIMGESIAAIYRKLFTGIIALLHSIFHNRPHGKFLFLSYRGLVLRITLLTMARAASGAGLRGAVPEMGIPVQPLLNAAEENLRSLVQDQRLRAHGAAELDRVRGEHDDLGAADELPDARLRLVPELGISGPDALIDQQDIGRLDRGHGERKPRLHPGRIDARRQ